MKVSVGEGKKILFVVLLFVGIFSDVFCQNNSDSISYKRLTKFALASVDYTAYSASEYGRDNEDIRMNEYRAKLQFALKLKEKKTYLLNNVSISKFDAYANKGASQYFNESYFAISYSIGLIQILKNRWKIVGVLSPTLASDFNKATSKHDFILQYSAIASKRVGPNLEYGFGAAYSTRFGRALAIPLVSYAYQKGNWSHTGVIPAYIGSYYNIRQIDVGMKLSTFGNVYNSTNSIVSQFELDKLGYSRVNIGPNIKFCIFKSLYANINTGITVRNRLFSIDSQGGLEMELTANTKYFLNFGLSILR